jgi:phospholipid transport system substrate-binding protein
MKKMNRLARKARGLNRLFVTLPLAVLSAQVMAQQTPVEVVEEAMGMLASGIEGHQEELTADKTALYALIDDILLPRFARKSAAQSVLGRKHWSGASEEQRVRFIDAFYTSLVRKYADGALKFDQERIEIMPFRGDLTKRSVTVNTVVTIDDGTSVSVDYVLVTRDDRWQMIDVKIEGVGYIKSFRDQLDAEIRKDSLESMILRLESEVEGYPAE